MIRLTSTHESGLEALKEIEPKMSLKVSALHNEWGVLNVNWAKPPGRYELCAVESMWLHDPINHFLNGAELERETDGPNPFANGFANGNAGPKPARNGKLKRRI